MTLIWQIMFSPRQGLIANLTEMLGGTQIAWLTGERFVMDAIVIATVRWSIGIALVLFLAGLQASTARSTWRPNSTTRWPSRCCGALRLGSCRARSPSSWAFGSCCTSKCSARRT